MGAPQYRVDPKLTEWATDFQRRCIEATNKAGSLRGAAADLKVHPSAVSTAIKRVERKAAIHGFSPQHDLSRPVAPGQILRGASTLYRRGEPEPVLQWVKSSADADQRDAIIRESIAALMDDVPKQAPVCAPKSTNADLCNVYTLTDCHVGMRAWGKETGSDWDLAIAEKVLCGAFDHMIQSSPAADKCVIAQLGDFLHFDSLEAVTPSSKHLLDADSRYSKVIRVAVRVLRYIVNAALATHQTVILLIAEGNHDMSGSVWLRQMFELLYEQEKRVQVIDSELPYYAIQHGNCMIGWHHGHLKKPDQLPGMFAAQFAVMWGATTKRHIHVGHLHHVYEREHSGVTVIQHPTLSSRDAYAARGGWISERQVTSITYHRTFGNVARNTVTPEMLELIE